MEDAPRDRCNGIYAVGDAGAVVHHDKSSSCLEVSHPTGSLSQEFSPSPTSSPSVSEAGSPPNIRLSIVTPTKRRDNSDYIQVLAASIWSTVKPTQIDPGPVKRWTILNSDREITYRSGLDVVVNSYEPKWWGIVDPPDYGDLLDLEVLLNLTTIETENHPRLVWRARESLDYASALRAAVQAVPNCTHVVIFQDDVVLSVDWVERVTNYLALNDGPQLCLIQTWFLEENGKFCGSVGTAFTKEEALELADFIWKNYCSYPVDWIVKTRRESLGRPEPMLTPGIGQHIGLSSSLQGKKQPLASNDWAWGETK